MRAVVSRIELQAEHIEQRRQRGAAARDGQPTDSGRVVRNAAEHAIPREG